MPQFFFSSRRRHTRYIGDWSSDVCSSDLMNHQRKRLPERLDQQPRGNIRDDHHWNDPAENYAEQSWENRVRITRNVQKIKIAVDQSLSAHDPETDRGQAQHY